MNEARRDLEFYVLKTIIKQLEECNSLISQDNGIVNTIPAAISQLKMQLEELNPKLYDSMEKDCDKCPHYGRCDHQGVYKTKEGKWCHE